MNLRLAIALAVVILIDGAIIGVAPSEVAPQPFSSRSRWQGSPADISAAVRPA